MDPHADVPLVAWCARLDGAGTAAASLTVHDDGRAALTDALLARDVGRGVVVLATCCRLEVYVSPHEDGGDAWPVLRDALAATWGSTVLDDVPWRSRRGAGAAQHLFRTACGLESPIVGDVQVLGQVRRAFVAAQDLAAPDPLLYELFRRTLQLGKWARRATAIAAGGAGVGSAACDTIFARRGPRAIHDRVIVVGAGDAAAAVVRALVARGVGDITVLNRSAERASGLVAAVGAPAVRARPFTELPAQLAGADVIVVAAPAAALDASWDHALEQRRGPQPLVIDLAHPQATRAGTPADVVCLGELVDASVAARALAVPTVEDACEDATRSFVAWHGRREVEGVLRSLYREVDAMVDRVRVQLEIARPEDVDRVLRRHLHAALHPHVEALRRLNGDLVTAGACSASPAHRQEVRS